MTFLPAARAYACVAGRDWFFAKPNRWLVSTGGMFGMAKPSKSLPGDFTQPRALQIDDSRLRYILYDASPIALDLLR